MYTPTAIKLLNEKFVCFAPGWNINTKDEVYQAALKRVYFSKPRSDEGNGRVLGTRLVLMTSTGRLLSGSIKSRNGLAQGLQGVLTSYARLPESVRRAESVEGEVKPQLAPPPGGLVLTIHDRALNRDEEGGYRVPKGNTFAGLKTHPPHGQRSSLWLKQEECASLIPENPVKGQSHKVPTKLAKRIWLYGLVPQTIWYTEKFWDPDSVKEGDLELTVVAVSPERIVMRLHGSVLLSVPDLLNKKKLEDRYDPRLEGQLEYDRAKKRIVRWNFVALGDYTGRWWAGGSYKWHEATPEAPLPLGFAFELDQTSYELPPERRRPRSFVHAYIHGDSREAHYWDPDKWLESWKKKQKK